MTDNTQHMAVLDEVESSLKVIEEQGKEVVDFATADGYARAKEIKKPLVRLRTTGNTARLAATKYHRDEQSRINELWNGIAARIEAVEAPLTEGIKRIDDENKRIKAEEEAAEQMRVDVIKARIADIRAAAGNAITLDDVTAAITRYGNVTLESFEELSDEAEKAIADMDTALAAKKSALQAQADEAARLEAVRIEQDAAAARMAEQQAEIDRQQRELRESQEAEERRKADAIAAEQKRKDDEAAETARKAEQDARDKAQAEQAAKDKQEALGAAETKRLADVEAARLKAIADEQTRVNAENARIAEEKAEAERAPDKEKLQAWLDSIPSMKTKAGKAAALKIADQSQTVINSLGSRTKAA